MKRIGLLLFLLIVSFAFHSNASHIIGGELGYTHIVNNTYEVKLTLYGDCAGTAFPGLPTSIPRVEVYKNGSAFFYIDLVLTGPGVEVSPVCPAQASQTTCVSTSGTLPGVMRYEYTGQIDLDGPAALWSFEFTGRLGGNAGAGRTNAITNISGNTTMALKATLNNLNGPNNSSIFTTIPTPYFCLNMPQEYNQGGVDPDGDQLSFSLVPGLSADNTGTIVGNVSYIAPYTYLNPVAAVPGTFQFSTVSGQMSFTPNLTQTSLVVNKITETRAGVVVGTTMREMNLVVLNNCNNQPPQASFPNSTVNAFDSTRTITLCNADLNPVFSIQINDPDNQNVLVTVNGLPSGASALINGNQTANPVVTINWPIAQPTVPGIYNFYITCEDDGCPLTSNQTFAYTVIILQPIANPVFNNAKESCVPGGDGSIQFSTSSSFGGLQFALNGGAYQNSSNFSGLQAGTYTVHIKDASGCTLETVTVIDSTAIPVLNYTTDAESCFPGHDGSINASASSANGGILYYWLNSLPQQPLGSFSQLNAGTYTISVQDISGCVLHTVINLPAAPVPVIDSIPLQRITCFGRADGVATVAISPAGLAANYTLLPGGQVNTSGVFKNLAPGNYTVYVTTAKQCSDTAQFIMPQPDPFLITSVDIDEATCDKDNARMIVTTTKNPPLIYTLRPLTVINTSGMFSDLPPGVYTLTVRDSNFCTVDSVVSVTAQPNLFSSTMQHADLPCNGWGTEGNAEVSVTGGVQPYTYSWTTEPPQVTAKVDGLRYGWYFVHVTDATGCGLDDTVYIKPGSCCEEVFLPNAFSPNGDQKNDTWRMVTTTGMTIEQFAVFDRWGEKIWHTRDQEAAWDGRFKGAEVASGTYFYLLRYRCLNDNKMYLKKGDVQVIR